VYCANRKAAFLIIEQPRSLTIFNQYQQRISDREAASLVPFTPFRILVADAVLGDGFTPCMKVEVAGTVFYLCKDEDGSLFGHQRAGDQRVVQDATVLGDTVEILRGDRLTLTDAQQNRTSSLEKGTRVQRVFSSGGLTFVKVITAEESYGWVNFDPSVQGKDWDHAKLIGVSTADVMQRILPPMQLKVSEVNEKIRRLFDYLNTTSSRKLQPPQWSVQQSGAVLRCVLANTTPAPFTETTFALGKSVESFILGTNLRVLVKPGLIEVRE
jgi:hypothetical protein